MEGQRQSLAFELLGLHLKQVKKDVVAVQIRGLLPAQGGWALFLGNDEKVFVIQVDPSMGEVIGKALRGVHHERPLTHELFVRVFSGFGIEVDRVVITELRNQTYFARLFLRQQNELGANVVEIDARPSDCLALAAMQKRPVFVRAKLFQEVEDMSEALSLIGDDGGDIEPA